METVNLNEHPFSVPCTITLAGPSFSGKTSLVKYILDHRDTAFDTKFAGVVYCYSEMQDMFRTFEGTDIILHYGMVTMEQLESYIKKFNNQPFLLIMDDLQDVIMNDSTAEAISTRIAHHRGFAALTIRQNIFAPGRTSRTQSVNSQYLVLTRAVRDKKQIGVLGSQLFPGRGKIFMAIYDDAMNNPINKDMVPYIYLNCHPLRSQSDYQIMTNVFTPNGVRIVYRI